MMPQSSEAYGRHWLPLLAQGVRDRLRGAHGRANARWGHVRAPGGTGKVIWLKTGAGEDSVHLGAELLAAIRHKRLDVRLVLTFEQDYPALLNQHLARLEKIGVGYGPCDARRAVRRTLNRLDPFAVIWVDAAPDPNLLAAANDERRHAMVFGAAPCATGRVEAAYPATPAQLSAWQHQGGADYVAPAADFRTLLVEAQVEATLRGLVCAGRDLTLWWVHGDDAEQLRSTAAGWRHSALAEDGVLFVSGETDGGAKFGADLLISEWPRTGLAPATVVAVDDRRWLAAVAAAVHAQH
ncbi:MAG: glycosyltransferase N-terminal domain-containing protein, partial [Gammaproteobacteria bacterium]